MPKTKTPRDKPVRRTTTDEIPVPAGVPVIDWGNGKYTAYWNTNHKGKA